ncbi:hypothetical protein [Lysobacter enzymogenes]|uniref:hypothetical protein n=1 Tax=Lysobacter enzymogenes TaxID=69 RepID=UPI0037479DC3
MLDRQQVLRMDVVGIAFEHLLQQAHGLDVARLGDRGVGALEQRGEVGMRLGHAAGGVQGRSGAAVRPRVPRRAAPPFGALIVPRVRSAKKANCVITKSEDGLV